jgi:penicillin amidase
MRLRVISSSLLVLAALAALALPGGARAAALRAETILPPGQSGFLADPAGGGTDSPHVYDQVAPFVRFAFKPAPVGGAAAVTTERPRPGLTITRDAFGVPSVRGRTERDVFFGAGYAAAQDRLTELELFRRRGRGTLAEILGPDSVRDDVVARRDYYTAAELRRMIRRLPAGLQARFTAYTAGVNAHIARVRGDRRLLPVEFTALGIPLSDWTELDTARIGVLLARTIPSGDGNELDNLEALRELGPRRFAALVPLRVPGQVPTIPARDGRFPSQPGRTRADERRAFARSQRALRRLPIPGEDDATVARAAGVPTGTRPTRPAGVIDAALGNVGGSFMWAIRRPSDDHAFLVNGPQLGYQAPSTFLELDLRGPRTRVRGGTAPGIPVIGPGFNDHVAWGFTSGLSDEDDLFAERLVGGTDAERYRFRGRTRRMDCRTETFQARGAPARRVRLCRTVHGPVQARADGTAYARRYALWMRELETLDGLARLNDARSVQDVDRALRRVTWNENIIAADDRGNIGYWHPGLHPLRPLRFDERLPFPGTGEAEWRGLLPRSRTPHVINPRGRRWLDNWNNVPSAGWTSGDAPARERLNGPYHRITMQQALVARAAASPTYRSAGLGVLRRSASIATQRPAAGPLLRRLAAGATGPAATVLRTLVAWDGNYTRTDAAGTIEPGAATWEAFKAAAQRRLFDDDTPLVGEPGSDGFVESTLGETFALRTASRRQLRAAAADAAAALTERFGTPDPTRWRAPRPTIEAEQQGLVNPPPIPLQNRGSYEQIVELGRR